MPFELFDPRGEIDIAEGRLPHWFQAGVTYFITFRTADSVPRAVIDAWQTAREAWLVQHQVTSQSLGDYPKLQAEYHERFTLGYMEYLDRGFGECLLRHSSTADTVANALHRFDGDRYHLGDYVIMPNHVHVLVCLMGGTQLTQVCNSWKHFSAKRINEQFGRRGRFWQSESFDHLVRSESHFRRLQKYIRANPAKAGLATGYRLWNRDSLNSTCDRDCRES